MKFKNKFNNTLFIIVSLILTLCITSCVELDEFSDNTSTDLQLTAKEDVTVEDFDELVISAYQGMYLAMRFNSYFVAGWAGDDITTFTGGNKGDFRQFDQRIITPTNGRVQENWTNIFRVFSRVNLAVDQSEVLRNKFEGKTNLSTEEIVEKETIERLYGELLVLEAIALHHLVRIHEKIPLSFSTTEVAKTLSSTTEVYERIEEDLIKAEELLPNVSPGIVGATRPNKGSAQALLSRLYLDWAGFPVKDNSKYAKAAEKVKEVIDNSEDYNFELLDDPADLWLLENRYNNESVVAFNYNTTIGQGNFKYARLGYPTHLGGWDETFAEIRFFEDFPEGPRKKATYRTDLKWETFTTQKSPVFAKITGPAGDIDPSVFQTNRVDFLMRYAEVLLTYAEASGRSGNVTDEAWEALNMVRRRAEGMPVNVADSEIDITTGDIAELAFTERKWELAGEFLRWFDLVRMERVEEALSNREPQVSKTESGDLIKEHNKIVGSLGTENYFAPIPAQVLIDNPGFVE